MNRKMFNVLSEFIKKERVTILLTLGLISLCMIPEAHGAGLEALNTKLKSKISDVFKVLRGLAEGGIGLGFLWVVISLATGNPNYKYAGLLMVAGSLLFCVSRYLDVFIKMYKSFVLRYVTEPPKLIMANVDGTMFSFISSLGVGFLGCLLFPDSATVVAVFAVLALIIVQGFMIYMTYRDPFYFNVWMADLSCRKTKNFIKSKDNVYGD